ncbi:MAG: GFA family protein [Rhodobacteraceae bacterium]|uniref:GFA family protein n=1 Tax=Amaricoccus sp. TaxID=1872485 RepID=UPI001D1F5C4C|nr:GFA family protein [Amaricoccus sp.]MCB1373021.1 GFA family protein [Paracoccaceae bacterium]MCB1403136.1 GFA family protein [Paracoccaceae bacterium]HRW15046.1 GFA family protein [Amaricoccus sp.]
MHLEGSCHCGAVRFSLESRHPAPFNLCYCSICRKTAGAGGYAINIGGETDTLVIEGEENIRSYNALLHDPETGAESRSLAERKFCGLCGSALWVWDPRWPELVHPHASAIDTDLPVPPERTHLMLGSRANWAEPCLGPTDKTFDAYPSESIAAWHERLGMER